MVDDEQERALESAQTVVREFCELRWSAKKISWRWGEADEQELVRLLMAHYRRGVCVSQEAGNG